MGSHQKRWVGEMQAFRFKARQSSKSKISNQTSQLPTQPDPSFFSRPDGRPYRIAMYLFNDCLLTGLCLSKEGNKTFLALFEGSTYTLDAFEFLPLNYLSVYDIQDRFRAASFSSSLISFVLDLATNPNPQPQTPFVDP